MNDEGLHSDTTDFSALKRTTRETKDMYRWMLCTNEGQAGLGEMDAREGAKNEDIDEMEVMNR